MHALSFSLEFKWRIVFWGALSGQCADRGTQTLFDMAFAFANKHI